MDIIKLYEILKEYLEDNQHDDLFYDAPEGDAQVEIVKEMLMEVYNKI